MRRAVVGLLALAAGCRGPIDLSDAGYPFPCDHQDAGAQCSPGWRCGLEDRCHKLGDTTQAWLCANSSDCEGGWQCSLSGTCVDARNDGLYPSGAQPMLTVSELPGKSPASGQFVVEGFYPAPSQCGTLEFAATIAWVDGGTLVRENYFPSGRHDPRSPGGGICSGQLLHRTLGIGQLPHLPVVGMTSVQGDVWVLAADGALCHTGVEFADFNFTCGATMQGRGLSGHGRWLASHDDSYLFLYDSQLDAGLPKIAMPFKVESVAAEDLFGQLSVFLGTDGGLLTLTLDDAGFPAAAGIAPGDFTTTKFVHPRGDYTRAPSLIALGTELDAGAAVGVLLVPNPDTRAGPPIIGPLASLYYPEESQPCGLMLPGLPEDATTGVEDDGVQFLEGRFNFGGLRHMLELGISSNLSCKPLNPSLSAAYQGPVLQPISWPGEGLIDGRGHVWLNRYPLVPDRAPSGGAGGDANLALTYEPLDSNDPATWAGSVEGGLELRSQEWLHGRVFTGVTGDPRLWITTLGVEDRSQPETATLLLGIDPTTLHAPFHATEASRDAGTLLVMSAFDSLLSGTLDFDAGSVQGSLTRRLAPVPGAAIDSVAFYGEEPGYFAHGYAVATGLLVEIKGKNPLGWTAEPMDLAQLAPLRVWIDRGRGRVGTLDGRIETLPSRVEVTTSPLPEPVLEYQQLCNDTFALTRSTVFWLKADPATGKGGWVPLYGTSAEDPFGSMYATEKSLLVGSVLGTVTVLSRGACP